MTIDLLMHFLLLNYYIWLKNYFLKWQFTQFLKNTNFKQLFLIFINFELNLYNPHYFHLHQYFLYLQYKYFLHKLIPIIMYKILQILFKIVKCQL